MNRGAEMMEDGSMTLRGLRYTRLAVVALLVAMMTLTVAPISLAQAPGTLGDPPTTAPENPRGRVPQAIEWITGMTALCGG